MHGLGRLGALLALLSTVAVAAAGCGGDKTDVSAVVDTYNDRLSQRGFLGRLECPDEVEGREGTEFECTLRAEQGGQTEKVTMEIRKEGDDIIAMEKDPQEFERAVQTVAGGQQQGQQGGQQPGGQAPPGGQQPGGQAPPGGE
jgi:hypothetical protein